jgi:hypothetical protein
MGVVMELEVGKVYRSVVIDTPDELVHLTGKVRVLDRVTSPRGVQYVLAVNSVAVDERMILDAELDDA